MSAMMFRAIVWKELRENLKWAVVVLLGMAAALVTAIPTISEVFQGPSLDIYGTLNALDGTTMIGGLLAGLLLGAAQTLLENRGDKWGFLTHRPINRTTLFRGKVTAGILLYLFSTGAPLALVLFWISLPGYLPVPFDSRIALPAIANLLCGLVFYFAGFLTGMREARWYVSRALGIGAAVCCLILQGPMAATFWQAVAASTGGLILVGTAAWGTFVAGGQYGVQPRFGRVATAVSIGLGIMLVGWLALAMNLNKIGVAEEPDESGFTTYTITSDGELLRVTTWLPRVASGAEPVVEIRDPGGRPLEKYRNFTRKQIPRADVLTVTLSPGPQATTSFRSHNRLFSQVRRATAADPLNWYYLPRQDLLAGYDSESGKLAGWIGPDGFSPGDARPRPFAGGLKNRSLTYADDDLLLVDDAVYQLELGKRRIGKIFQAEPAETVLNAGRSHGNPAALEKFGAMEEFVVISTTRRLVVQRRDGTRLLEVPWDAQSRRHAVLQVSRALQAPGSPIFVWYRGFVGEDERMSEFNSEGAVVNSWTLPPTNRLLQQPRSRIAVFSALTPLIGLATLEIAGPDQEVESFFFGRTTYWPVAILSSLVSAAIVFLLGKRYAFPPGRLLTWTGIALLLGPLGCLLMLALIEWPALESCPACSRKRVVTRERCEHCGEPFAAPPQDGTEILELPSRQVEA